MTPHDAEVLRLLLAAALLGAGVAAALLIRGRAR